MTKLKNLAPAFARIARLEKIAQDAYDKREIKFHAIRKESNRVAWAAIKKAGWKRGETLLAAKDGGWAIGIYQGTSLSWIPCKAGEKWSFTVHTLSVRDNGKPGKRKGSHYVAVDDPAKIADTLKIVGVISPAKLVHP